MLEGKLTHTLIYYIPKWLVEGLLGNVEFSRFLTNTTVELGFRLGNTFFRSWITNFTFGKSIQYNSVVNLFFKYFTCDYYNNTIPFRFSDVPAFISFI